MIRRITSFLACVLVAAGAARAAEPNIVVIISDDQHWADYGFMGHPTIETPRLDKLAAESLTFTRGYVPCSLCCPSLASFITGQYPHQHGVTSNDPPLPEGMAKKGFQNSPLFQEGRKIMSDHLQQAGTLPKMLQEKGYLSLQTGKWWQQHYSQGGFTHGMTEGGRHGDKGLDIGRKTMQPIYDFIADARKQEKPFFVWYAPMMPHEPHTPPERLLKKHLAKEPNEHLAKYQAMVEWFDETCGELLDHLDQDGLRENTIVVYFADNGWITRPDSGHYAEKSKQSQYDGGLRTPIMIRWPGRVEPRMSSEPAISIDLVPTLLKAASLRPTAAMQGVDLLDAAAVSGRKAVFGECFTHNSMDLNRPAASLRWRWMVEGNWKLIVPHPANQPDDAVELYDLKSDPNEEKNLAAENADRVAAMKKGMDAWWKP